MRGEGCGGGCGCGCRCRCRCEQQPRSRFANSGLVSELGCEGEGFGLVGGDRRKILKGMGVCGGDDVGESGRGEGRKRSGERGKMKGERKVGGGWVDR